MIQKIAHFIIQLLSRKNYNDFIKALSEPKKNQLRILNDITGNSSYDEFKAQFPIVSYSEIKSTIEELKSKKKELKFVPTSGSTHAIKWIPYTQKFKSELWKASSAWVHDLYLRYPEIKNGTHYWSLSWLPIEMRNNIHNDDLDFFDGLEKLFLKLTMTVDSRVLETSTLEESLKMTLLYILNREVTLISVWSPTFLLELLEKLFSNKEFFMNNLKSATKIEQLSISQNWTPELVQILFPKLSVISCWATSSSKQYALKLKSMFPKVHFEHKGLWATEGVITFPFNGHFPLAVNSHFYEFRCLETNKIFPSWELAKGMKVSPIITTGANFVRYELNDQLLVLDFLENTPCFDFLGRLNSTDIVGEKISTDFASHLIELLGNKYSCRPICLMAMEIEKPYYRLLVDGREHEEKQAQMSEFLEQNLKSHFHYKLARELGQLMEAKVIFENDSHLIYHRIKEKAGMIKGNIKIEPLILCKEEY